SIRRLVHCIDAERGAMSEQCRLAVAIECRQRIPKLTFILRQLLCPLLMAGFDRLRRGAVGETGPRLSAPSRASWTEGAICAATERVRKDSICEGCARACHLLI